MFLIIWSGNRINDISSCGLIFAGGGNPHPSSPHATYECDKDIERVILGTFKDLAVNHHWAHVSFHPAWARTPATP